MCERSVRQYVNERLPGMWFPAANANVAASQMEAHGAQHGWRQLSALPSSGKAVVFLNTDNVNGHAAVYNPTSGQFESDGKSMSFPLKMVRSIWVPSGKTATKSVPTVKHKQARNTPTITIKPTVAHGGASNW